MRVEIVDRRNTTRLVGKRTHFRVILDGQRQPTTFTANGHNASEQQCRTVFEQHLARFNGVLPGVRRKAVSGV